MAKLTTEDGRTFTEIPDIENELSALGIRLNRWPVGDDPELCDLLARPTLTDGEKARVLESLDGYFRRLAESDGYKTRDLIVINEEVPNLEQMLAKFDKCHTHSEDEVRYIVDGEGIFGFVRPDGSQVELMVEAEEYINVPTGTEHYFYLTRARRIKAVRYFTSTEGWTPEYTGTPRRLA
ncbi:acireductone dioxygenase [bacterium]|nr:acireductone dioxygenase [bacterium]